MRTNRSTAIFTKLPEAGLAKTRLCPPLSPEQAAELAEAMLADVVEELAGTGDLEIAVAPVGGATANDRRAWFRSRFPGIGLTEQVGQGLGERLAGHFEARLANASSAVVVGSDVPELRAELVTRAHEVLADEADVVFGPDGGGGYYLVGARAARSELFTRVPMSTDDMYARTLELARELGLRVHELPVVGDVDTERDLERLSRHGATLPAKTADCLRRLELTR